MKYSDVPFTRTLMKVLGLRVVNAGSRALYLFSGIISHSNYFNGDPYTVQPLDFFSKAFDQL